MNEKTKTGLEILEAAILLENLPSMNFEPQSIVKNKLLGRFDETAAETNFRSWNWARNAARNAMTEQKENLITANCPAYTQSHRDDF